MSFLIENACVLTMDANRQRYDQGALVIEGERIVDIGNTHDVASRNPQIERRIDAQGKVLLPGFVSTHNHLGYSIFRGRAEDVGHVAVQGLYVPMSAIMTRQERQVMADLTTAELLRGGITTVVQMEEDADVAAPFVESIGMRALMGIMAHDIDVDALNKGQIVFDETVRQQQIEQSLSFAEHIHGRANGRLQAVMAANTANTASPALLRELRNTADRLGVKTSIHMGIGEEAEVKALHGTGTFAYCRDNGFLDSNTIAVHCYMVQNEDIELMAKSGASLAHCPLMNQFRGCIAPMQDMRNKGITVGLGIDNYFADHFDVMRAAIAVARIRANDPQAILSEDALAMATCDAAKTVGMEADIGSLEIGKKADVQLIDCRRFGLTPLTDPAATIVYHGHAGDVDTVIVDGNVVVENGNIKAVDSAALLAEANTAGQAVWQRFKEKHGSYCAR